jgi:uncharacterized membrane protein
MRVLVGAEMTANDIAITEDETMATITRSIDINAPVEKVFTYLIDPTSGPEWMVSMMEVSNVSGSGVGQRYNWKYKMIGIPFEGESTVTEQVPNERGVVENKGGIPSTFSWTFTPVEGGTRLDLEVDYTIPVPVLGKMAEKLVLNRNEREADLWMQNLKQKLEA